jgi:hypothetical protein
MPPDTSARKAIALAHRDAEGVLKRREQRLRLRRRALRAHPAPVRLRIEHARGRGARLRRPVVTEMQTAGVLVAEGDSWFDYPFNDVLSELEDRHGYDVESVAHKGDPIEAMAYGDGQLEAFARLVEKVISRGTPLKAVLLSGGGNDIAGDEFAMLLDHARSAAPGLNDDVVSGIIGRRVRNAYIMILQKITDVCVGKTGAPAPILVHGYDYAVPDGRGFMGGWGPLPGPWLEPGFRAKGFGELRTRVAMIANVIDRFNAMLKKVAALFPHVYHIDLRGSLSNKPADYKNWWANELHPTEPGFRRVAAKFERKLRTLP